MYTEGDMRAIDRRIRQSWLAIIIAAALFLGLYIAALALRVRWLVTGAGVMLFASVAFIAMYYLTPNLRYRGFLRGIAQGLVSELSGRVAAIDDAPQAQDGARVLPVRLSIADGRDERIVYLNADKRALFPGSGRYVHLKLCGRHILEVTEE